MNWKISLDKWLTTPYDDGFDNWSDEILGNQISDKFYYKNEDWLNESGGQFDKWLNILFKKNKDARTSARIIERAFNLYKLS